MLGETVFLNLKGIIIIIIFFLKQLFWGKKEVLL